MGRREEREKRRVGAGCVSNRGKKKPEEKSQSTATPSLKSLRLLPCLVKGTRRSRLKRSSATLAESLRVQGGEREKKVDWCVCLD